MKYRNVILTTLFIVCSSLFVILFPGYWDNIYVELGTLWAFQRVKRPILQPLEFFIEFTLWFPLFIYGILGIVAKEMDK